MAESDKVMNDTTNDFKSLTANSDFMKLFWGQLISGFGDWLATFAFIALVYTLTGSTTQVALILVLRLVPPLFAGPIGGVLADRQSRKKIMISADVARCILIGLVPFVGLWFVYLIALLHEVISLFFLPARDAVVPQLATNSELEAANGMMLASSYGALPFAGAVFAALHHVGMLLPMHLSLVGGLNIQPESMSFWLDAITFVCSAAFISWMRLPREITRLRRRPRTSSFARELIDGIKLIWHNQTMRSLMYGLFMAMFGAGVLFAVGISYIQQTLHGSTMVFGWLTALWGLGMALGLLLIRRFSQIKGEYYTFVSAVAICGAVIVVMALLPLVLLAYVLAVPFGMAFAVAIVLAMTIAQKSVKDTLRGRMMGGLQTFYRLGLGLGALSIGTLAHSIHSIKLIITLDGNQFGMLVSGVLILMGAAMSAWRVIIQTGQRYQNG